MTTNAENAEKGERERANERPLHEIVFHTCYHQRLSFFRYCTRLYDA